MFEIIGTDQQFAMLKTGSVNASDYQVIWAEHRYRPRSQTRFILQLSGGTSPYLSPATAVQTFVQHEERHYTRLVSQQVGQRWCFA